MRFIKRRLKKDKRKIKKQFEWSFYPVQNFIDLLPSISPSLKEICEGKNKELHIIKDIDNRGVLIKTSKGCSELHNSIEGKYYNCLYSTCLTSIMADMSVALELNCFNNWLNSSILESGEGKIDGCAYFVILKEYSNDFATKEKPWLKCRQTVFMPIGVGA